MRQQFDPGKLEVEVEVPKLELEVPKLELEVEVRK